MISCKWSKSQNEIKVEGNMILICAETEDLLRHIRIAIGNSIGEEGAKDMMKHIFESSLVSMEDASKKDSDEMGVDLDKEAKSLRDFFNSFYGGKL